MTPIPPPSPYVPAREERLRDWRGPVIYDDAAAVLIGPDEDYPGGQWCLSRPEGWDVMNNTTWCLCAETQHIRLNPSRPEVRHLIADRLGVPPEYRSGAYSAGMCWWSGTTGRKIVDVFEPPRKGGLERTYRYGLRYVIEVGDLYVARHSYTPGWRIGIPVHERTMGDRDIARGPETGDAGKLAADTAALAHDCALVTPAGLLLPPLTPGTAPVLWSTPT